jgi:hypothetical protein
MVMYYAKDQRWTKVERVTVVARIHRWAGYIMLFFGNIVVSGGLTTYINTLEQTKWGFMGFLTLFTFIVVCIFYECRYRRKHQNTYHFDKLPANWKKNLVSYTPDKLEYEVEIGHPLVVFDQFVLNCGWFEKIHPGGRFTINKNYGRDISKFYYGGYVLVNGKGIRAYNHSPTALAMVESMVVGTMEEQSDVRENDFYLVARRDVSKDTYCFEFQEVLDRPLKNHK